MEKNTKPSGTFACKQTLFAYPKLRDYGPVEEYGKLFSKESIFSIETLNIKLKGRTQITQRLEKELQSTQTHHVVSSPKIEYIGENNYKATSNFTVNIIRLLPQNLPPVTITGQYEDLLHFDGKRCQITLRQVNVNKPK